MTFWKCASPVTFSNETLRLNARWGSVLSSKKDTPFSAAKHRGGFAFFQTGMVMLACCLLAACRRDVPPGSIDADLLIAQYGDKKLLQKDLMEVIPGEMHGNDSAQFVNNYIDRWLRDQILIQEATKELGSSGDITKMVDEYRNELLLLKFEDKILASKLDTSISDGELVQYYNSNKSKYKLESTIFRFVMVKALKPVNDANKLEQLFGNITPATIQALTRYCENNAEICFLNPERWYKWEEVQAYIPAKYMTEKNIQAGLKRDFADFNHAFKIKFFEVVSPDEDPPLSFVRDQARQAILHQRKIKLLEKYKADLYDRELKNKRIQIFNK